MNLSNYAKELGRRGGVARAKKLSSVQRKKIAKIGAQSRMASLIIAKRIIENFRYVEAIHELQPLPKVKSLSRFIGKLPGVYV